MEGHPLTEKDLFLAALEIQARDAQRAFLDEACGEDRALRQEVQALLDAHERLPLEEASGEGKEPAHESVGGVIGSYKLLERIAEGGMAVVYLAEQSHPIQRQVALKLIKPGMDSRQVIARFEAERQALALMDHPNIARVLDAGTTESGRPYFVMELVKGVPITRYCDENRLAPRDRLALFAQVCQAVQHAHQKGIIHRDLKPTNVLIALYDGKPVPKVIDFGVAKAIGQRVTESTIFTGFGMIVGTLEYMSPEQAELNQLDIDTRSDIYSLGVLLYELLTATTPLEHERLKRDALDEVLRTIRTEEPIKPSTRLSTLTQGLATVAAQRGLDPQRLAKLVRGELDWIVMKALEKDRSRRYQTASDLALDIERYLKDEAVAACPPSAVYRISKFSRRHRTGLLATVGVFASLVALVVVLSISNARVVRERNEKAAALRDAQAQRERAQAQRERAERNFLAARQAVARLMAQPASAMGEWRTLPKPLRKKFAEEAISYYNTLLAQEDADASIQYETAVGYRSIGFLDYRFSEYPEAQKLARQSIAILERLNKQDPKNRDYRQQLAWSRMLLGWTFLHTNKPAEAEGCCRQAAPLLEKLLGEDPRHQSYTNELGECYANLFAACEKQWAALDDQQFKQRAMKLPESVGSGLPHTCKLYNHVGIALQERRCVDESLAMHREALARMEKMSAYVPAKELESMRLDYRAALAETLVSAKRSDEAISLIEQDVAKFPKDPLVHSTLGHTWARLGQWDKAAAAFTKSMDLKLPDDQFWYCAAGVCLWRGDTQGYRRVCEAMLERFGKGTAPVGGVERTIRTCSVIPSAVGDFAVVERMAERLVTATEQVEPDRVYALAKGMAECRAGHHKQAIQWLTKFGPKTTGTCEDATGFALLAIAQRGAGDRAAARATLVQAREMMAKMPDPAKGEVFGGWSYVEWMQCRLLCQEAEKLLAEPATTQKSR